MADNKNKIIAHIPCSALCDRKADGMLKFSSNTTSIALCLQCLKLIDPNSEHAFTPFDTTTAGVRD
jgi:hypothetical protein